MNRRNRGAWAVALPLVCWFALGAALQGQGTVPAGDLPKLIAVEARNIDAELSKPSFLKKGQKRVRMAAFMIAVYAQDAKGDAPAMATLRDHALKVMKAAEAGKAEDTKKLAATLSADIKVDPAAKTTPLAIDKQLDLETLMRMFASEKSGGFGMEKTLEDLADAKGADTKADATLLLAEKVGMIARLTQAYAPESNQGKKTKESWNALCIEMQTKAGDLAAAARAHQGAAIGKIAGQLNATCTKCHDTFR